MAIDVSSEQLVSLAQVSKLRFIPHRRGGKRLHISTVFRWAQKGLRGIQLETLQFGGTRVTSVEALQRFFDRLSKPGRSVPSRTSKARQHAIEGAKRELAEAGI
jgi:Protein of unknown function (DUF1580)